MEIPLSSDHYGHIGVNSCIKLARAMEKYNLAWMEDMVPWQFGELMKQIKDATTTPILTGEDIYLKEEFIKLIDMGAVDMIHPDLASSGGLIETKKIGDYAMEHGVPMAMHFAGTPISFMANVHCAAATENFIALEHHSIDVPWWETWSTTGGKPLVEKGFAIVPDPPGLGVELNEEVVKAHLAPNTATSSRRRSGTRSGATIGSGAERRPHRYSAAMAPRRSSIVCSVPCSGAMRCTPSRGARCSRAGSPRAGSAWPARRRRRPGIALDRGCRPWAGTPSRTRRCGRCRRSRGSRSGCCASASTSFVVNVVNRGATLRRGEAIRDDRARRRPGPPVVGRVAGVRDHRHAGIHVGAQPAGVIEVRVRVDHAA